MMMNDLVCMHTVIVISLYHGDISSILYILESKQNLYKVDRGNPFAV